MIDEKFLENFPDDLKTGFEYLLQSFKNFDDSLGYYTAKLKKYEEYIDYYMLLEALLESKNYTFNKIDLGDNKNNNIEKIISIFYFLDKEFEKRQMANYHEESKLKFDILFKTAFHYEFSQGDLDRIQNLLNELRDLISKSELFTAEHKQRILKRLEKLQGELHKKVSDLDRFWGLIGDAGIAIGKFGKDAKPFVDRIKEIADIVWRTQARTEELPSGTTIPFLKEDNETD